MIKLVGVNKYFNKGKDNEIHVLKDINLELPEKGLIIICGESASGKTTLLNMIGGLDKPSSGTINFNEVIFTQYNSRKWDKLRNEEIGFVFQNYNLINELSVYDNIELVLKMEGIDNQEEITKRIDYITTKLGIFNYQKRLANALSRGQQQRVGIARVLVKNPKVIIADEPTGNLDSKTTIEIINIIKKISLNKLVILVTHELEIADFYADRIIEISNGEIIKDVDNVVKGHLGIKHEHIIYLKDLEMSSGSVGNLDLISYNDDYAKKLENIGVQIIQRNGTLYFKVNSNEYKNVKFLNKNSEIQLLDEKYKAIELIEENEFDVENIFDNKFVQSKRNVLNLKDLVKYASRKINSLTYGGKMLYVVLAFIGILIATSVGLIGQIYNIDDEEFIVTNRDYINISNTFLEYEDAILLEELESIDKLNFITESIEFTVETEAYYEIKNPIIVKAHPSELSLIDESDIVYGIYPLNDFDIVIDRMLADKLISYYSDRGINNYKDIINLSVNILAIGLTGDYSEETYLKFNVVGISGDDSPTVWMKEELIYSIAMVSLVEISVFGDGFELVEGNLPSGRFQVLLHEDSRFIRAGNVPGVIGIDSGQYEVVGTYRYYNENGYQNTRNLIATNIDVMKEAYYYAEIYQPSGSQFLASANDIDQAIEELSALGIDSTSKYFDDLEDFKEFELYNSFGLFIFALVGIVASAISVIFIMRSNLTSRIYEISIYRALGATKNDIRKLFIVEITIISTISSLIGFIFTAFILSQIQAQIIDYLEIVHFSGISFIIGVTSMYILNIFFGLIPVNFLIAKTPASILTQFDI